VPDAILGISAFYHDSAAALVEDGRIIAAAQEERFSRRRHDSGYPDHAVRYVMAEAGLRVEDLKAVAFYDKPVLKFERLLETYHALAPRGLRSFVAAMPVWVREKLSIRRLLEDELAKLGRGAPPLLFPEHHLSHAASAYYPSPFTQAAILTIDGVGEWATCTIGVGRGRELSLLRELRFPHSIGLLYSAFTQYCGFRVNSGEYKLMGLSAYGTLGSERVGRWRQRILDELVDLRDDGSILLNMDYFDFATGLTMCRESAWRPLFGLPPREAESPVTQEYMDLALAIQQVTEEAVLRLASTARELTGSRNLVLAGGVALNSVANGKLVRSGLFEDIWIQPASGDAGGALGAALAAFHIWAGHERPEPRPWGDAMQGAYLGPGLEERDVLTMARRFGAPFRRYPELRPLLEDVAALLAGGHVVGWCQGRMEFGPRALGNRSVLADARAPGMQRRLNLKTKGREGFRPFAPSVLDEDVGAYFELDRASPYMLLVAPVQPRRRVTRPLPLDERPLLERLNEVRSDIPAVTHVDFSARVQTVHRETNPRYWGLIAEFRRQTGCAVLVNTSFNVRGEPIVCSAEDAYRCFMRTDMDYLVLGDYLFGKKEQPSWSEDGASLPPPYLD
jgi:carbamoyltransferase